MNGILINRSKGKEQANQEALLKRSEKVRIGSAASFRALWAETSERFFPSRPYNVQNAGLILLYTANELV